MTVTYQIVHLDASEVLEVSGHVGGNLSIHCFASWSPVNISELYSVHFCRGACTGRNTVIQMETTSAAVTLDGRFSLELDGGEGVFTVTINRLKKADAGGYLCEMRRAFNVTYQEVSLKVVDVSTVPAATSPSLTTPPQMGLRTPRGNVSSNTEASNVIIMLPPSERKRRQKQTNNLTDTMVVIIISGSLAFLVCAIIPLIFYRHWRITAGQSRTGANKNKEDVFQENVDTASTHVAVGVQTSEGEDNPETGAEDNLQYAEVYEGLDPKTLE
ncbi:uncharacterized protein V3H82_000633 [Fundulus diaphanus]